MNKLCQDREKGGLGLPNLEKYYIAVNSRYPLWAYNYNMDIETRIVSINLKCVSIRFNPKYSNYATPYNTTTVK